MPIIKSAKKRMEIAARNNARNKSERSELATTIKKFNAAISNKDVQLA
ncbi:MAG: 30S ribosomal protein S20 [Clostridia bacterium]|nr:30S ribosomal protein S20 [Clostridia bacterium]